MLTRKKAGILITLFMATLVVYGVSNRQVKEFRDRMDPTQSISALSVKPQVLEVISGEFRPLLADYLLLKASVYLGGRWSTPESCKQAVATLFRQAIALDPYFFQTCYSIQGVLPWWGRVQEAIELLEISMDHRYWDWQPCFYIGFDYYYFLHENLKASKYLMEGSKRPHAPPLLGLLAARLAQRGGDTRAGIAFLKSMYKSAEKEKVKEEIKRRIEALTGVLKLEKAIETFRSQYGRKPDTLDQLVEAGILKKIPENPYKGPYTYKDGEIGF